MYQRTPATHILHPFGYVTTNKFSYELLVSKVSKSLAIRHTGEEQRVRRQKEGEKGNRERCGGDLKEGGGGKWKMILE